jgi:branched-chain amino acid transport system permease protein
VKGFAAAALGGLGNNKGALIAGVIIGVTEAVGSEFFSAGYQQTTIFAVVLAILLIRPQGLFGVMSARTV